MSENKGDLSRRAFLRMAAALGAVGVLAWKSDAPKAEAEYIGVDVAQEGADETAVIFFGTLGDGEHPFAPYFISGTGLPSDTWGMPDD